MLKRERQKKLLNLIRAKRVGTQEALRAHLERAGVPATQSSLSRDLEELGVVKHRGAYALPQANGTSARGLLSLDVAGDVLVIAKCLPGRASASWLVECPTNFSLSLIVNAIQVDWSATN